MESCSKVHFWHHIRHPFTISEKKTLSVRERVAAAALFCIGSFIALIGGPLLFYSYTYRLKEKYIRQLKSDKADPLRALQLNVQQIIQLPLKKEFAQQAAAQPRTVAQMLQPYPEPFTVANEQKKAQPLLQLITVPPSASLPIKHERLAVGIVQPKAQQIAQTSGRPSPALVVNKPRLLPPPTAVPPPAVVPIKPPQQSGPQPPLNLDFAALKLLSAAQGNHIENLYNASYAATHRYGKGASVSFQELAETKKDIDALEVALNEAAVHWLQIKDNDPRPSARDLARSALEEKTGLSARLRAFIASSKEAIIRFTNTPIDAKNLALEIEAMKKLPRELQDYRLESILSSQFNICKIISDGNCGPRALAQGLKRGDEHSVRKEVTDFLMKNLDNPGQLWRFFYEGNAEENVRQMQASGCYFTDRELSAFSELKRRPVGVLSIESIRVENNRLLPANNYFWGDKFEGTPIFLYHRPDHDNSGKQNQLELNHYDLLQPQLDAAKGLRPSFGG